MLGRRWALLGAMLLFAGCGKEPPPVITRVGLKVLPTTGGANYVELDSLGKVDGGNFGPGPQPAVRQDTATISAAEARAIFAETAALGDSLLKQPEVTAEGPGMTVIAVLYSDETQARLVWPSDHEHPDPRVRALAQHILSHKIGGW